jgi:hypothetical protein
MRLDRIGTCWSSEMYRRWMMNKATRYRQSNTGIQTDSPVRSDLLDGANHVIVKSGYKLKSIRGFVTQGEVKIWSWVNWIDLLAGNTCAETCWRFRYKQERGLVQKNPWWMPTWQGFWWYEERGFGGAPCQGHFNCYAETKILHLLFLTLSLWS